MNCFLQLDCFNPESEATNEEIELQLEHPLTPSDLLNSILERMTIENKADFNIELYSGVEIADLAENASSIIYGNGTLVFEDGKLNTIDRRHIAETPLWAQKGNSNEQRQYVNSLPPDYNTATLKWWMTNFKVSTPLTVSPS
jgi:hypothetical protein